MKLKKDGTPRQKPGRKPDPAKARKPSTFVRTAPRPHRWLVGPDTFKHSMYMPWQRAKAQANYRGEEWIMTFEEYYEMWKDQWHMRGRTPDSVCMTRIDDDGEWSRDNTEIISRRDHFKKTKQSKIANAKPYKKRKPKL